MARRGKRQSYNMAESSGEFAPWLGVFETLRVVNGVPLFLAPHQAELKRAMDALGLTSDFDFVKAGAALPPLSGRWRWLVTPEGTRTFFSEETFPPDVPITLSTSSVRIGSGNWDARFKTISYLTHIQAWKTGSTSEVVLLNEHGNIASGARANIFWRLGDLLFTPSHESGCRQGIVRSFVLMQRSVRQGHFPPRALQEADEIFLTNSIKGIVSVNQWEGRSLRLFSIADKLREEYEAEIAAQIGGRRPKACSPERQP